MCAKRTGIAWAGGNWNPFYGCSGVSPGCNHCYARREMLRYGKDFSVVTRARDGTFNAPRRWSPRVVFTCSWGDFFHPDADAWRNDAWDVIRDTPQHIYLILTKRAEHMQTRLPTDWGGGWEHVWLGVTAEDNLRWEYRVPTLLRTAARHRFISVEPQLERIDWQPVGDWLIVGGESGADARPFEPEWAEQLYDRCRNRFTPIPFFFKQHGGNRKIDGTWGGAKLNGRIVQEFPPDVGALMQKMQMRN